MMAAREKVSKKVSQKVSKIQYLITSQTDPYRNIALEERLLHQVEQGCVILYLWQNRKTVVIGRNQNCWKECNVTALEKDGGYLARRLSGGGAVFHDLGNLNFTFLASKEVYDVNRQLEVIVRACRMVGIEAEKNGRNDLTVDGKKFSGNAFYHTANSSYHHGTLLLRADMDLLSRYLNVDADKLKAKGVTSVKSRVTNLCEFCQSLTVERMAAAMVAAFEEVYERKAQQLVDEPSGADGEQLERQRFFASPEWKYGRHLPFTMEFSRRFVWGNVELQLAVREGHIEDALLYSDGLDETFLMKIPAALKGSPLKVEAMEEALLRLKTETSEQGQILGDVLSLLRERDE